MSEEMDAVATSMRNYFLALRATGFDDEQALYLTGEWQRALLEAQLRPTQIKPPARTLLRKRSIIESGRAK